MIGIDVGSAGVRVVDVQTTRGGDRILKRYAHEALPGGAVRAGVVHDEDAVVRALKQAFRGAKIHGRRASLAATSAQAVVREISMPHLSPKERAGALPHLARDVLPIPIERAVLDFAPTSAPNESQVTGLLVGMPADVVSGLVSAVEKAGVAVESVDFAAFAALRSLPPAPIAAAACVTLDLGASPRRSSSNTAAHRSSCACSPAVETTSRLPCPSASVSRMPRPRSASATRASTPRETSPTCAATHCVRS
jgi:type IV pilus assembly protein PilM